MPSLFVIIAAITFAVPPVPPSVQPTAAAVVAANAPYRVLKTFELAGEGGWDLLEIDSAAHRLYVPRSTRVSVMDTDTGKLIGEVSDTAGVHDVAIASSIGKGFTTNGKSNDISVFDLKTLKVEKTISVGKSPDAIIVEPTTKRVFVFNAKSNNASVISTEDMKVVATIELGGNPELTVVDGLGAVFVNLENTSEIVKLNAKTMAVEQRIALAPGEEPTGLAIDQANHLLFSACHNQKMVIVDTNSGKVIATPVIGSGVDGAVFDSARKCAITSNGEGTMTVVSTQGEPPFSVVQNLTTSKGARTMIMDNKTHLIYLPAADFELPAAGEKKGKWPKMKSGTFKILVVGSLPTV